jgi:3-deoxy-D-arabino-heptulosonate 7-phosphate (DAHP) synthase
LKAARKREKAFQKFKAEQERKQMFEEAVMEDDWSQEQQNAFEMALLDNPASVEKHERWNKVAAAVEGKNKQQCLARYKFLKEYILAGRHSSEENK